MRAADFKRALVSDAAAVVAGGRTRRLTSARLSDDQCLRCTVCQRGTVSLHCRGLLSASSAPPAQHLTVNSRAPRRNNCSGESIRFQGFGFSGFFFPSGVLILTIRPTFPPVLLSRCYGWVRGRVSISSKKHFARGAEAETVC